MLPDSAAEQDRIFRFSQQDTAELSGFHSRIFPGSAYAIIDTAGRVPGGGVSWKNG